MIKSVDIIIPIYNIEKYLNDAIKSVLNQTFGNFELILIDDGSLDKCPDICDKYAAQDRRIKVVHRKNAGVVEARKVGASIAKGLYLIPLDGDDWLENNCVEELYKTAIDKNADVVLYNAYKAYEDKKETFNTFNKNLIDDIKKNPIKNLLLDNISPTIWSKFIKRSFIEENNIKFPENISYAEDLATVSNIFINNPKIVFNENRLYNYYHRDNSISNKVSSKVLEVDNAIQFIEDKLVESNSYDENKEEFEFTVFRHMLISKILRINQLYPERKKVFKQYKARNIDINKNKYIDKYFSYGNRYLKLRINLYDFNYNIATICDKLLGYVQ